MKNILLNTKTRGHGDSLYSLCLRVLVFVILFASCDIESNLDMDDHSIDPKLVVNGVIYAGRDTNYINFSESYPIFDKENARRSYINEGYWSNWYRLDTKVYYLPDVLTRVFRNGVPEHTLYTNPDDSLSYCQTRFATGDRIRLEATHKGRTASAEVTIPPFPLITGIDTVMIAHPGTQLYYGDESDEYVSLGGSVRLFIHLKDEHPETMNYYRIFVDCFVEVQYTPEYARYNECDEVVSYETSYITSEDPLITNGVPKDINDSDIELFEFEQNRYNIFTDELFSGGDYKLNVYTQSYGGSAGKKNIVRQKMKVQVRLQAISEEYYKYLASLQKMLYYSYELAEPVRVFCNIDGGLGILGTVNERTETVFEKEYIYK